MNDPVAVYRHILASKRMVPRNCLRSYNLMIIQEATCKNVESEHIIRCVGPYSYESTHQDSVK